MSLKFHKILFGGALIGATAALASTYLKKYNDLKPETPEGEEGEEGTRSYFNVDKDAAVEAAKQTAESVKNGAVKAWGVTKDSAKAVSDVIMDNYGDSINASKAKVDDALEGAKEKLGEVKEAASEKFGEIKESNPEVFEKIDEFKETAREKFDEVVERFQKSDEEAPEGECCCGNTEDAKEQVEEAFAEAEAAVTGAEEGVEEAVQEAEQKAEDFIQSL